ncbi:uncharacterized protein LOC111240835 [Vigna radiata var. radiata]|uniref:Uncharacterized protein LOC111240835 n=1 Tax=Vigna radiata var. radiata TaxID=3916 RepID=A0A3Q0EMS9_VIGRR|nr:uncharacterized protein LOC111240835 [Vigna radiata var. radiata]
MKPDATFPCNLLLLPQTQLSEHLKFSSFSLKPPYLLSKILTHLLFRSPFRSRLKTPGGFLSHLDRPVSSLKLNLESLRRDSSYQPTFKDLAGIREDSLEDVLEATLEDAVQAEQPVEAVPESYAGPTGP